MSFLMASTWLVLAFLAASVGCALLAVSQSRNWRNVHGGTPGAAAVRTARMTGWILVFASLVFCLLRDGASFAALLWPLILAVAAFLVAMLLAYAPAPVRVITKWLTAGPLQTDQTGE